MEQLIFRLCCQNQFNSVVVARIGRASRICRSIAPGINLGGANFVPFMASWLSQISQWPQEIFDAQPVPRFGAEKDKGIVVRVP